MLKEWRWETWILIQNNIILNPGPGQYDLAFTEELKVLNYKLSARYRKVPFGTSCERFKLKEYNENIKKNKKLEEAGNINSPNEANRKFYIYNFI